MPAELIISNMYSNQFGTGNKTVAQIRKEGVNAFKIEYESPKESSQYDFYVSPKLLWEYTGIIYKE